MKSIILFLGLLSTDAFGWTLLSPNLQGWQRDELKIGVNTANCTISDTDLFQAVDDAINIWNSVPTTDIIISRTTSTTSVSGFLAGSATDAPILACDTNFEANGNGSADSVIGVARVGSSSPISYGGILLNAQAGGLANISSFNNVQLAVVMAHEMGHLLGLGHSTSSDSLMYFSISGKDELYLDQDDMDGMTYLYNRNELGGGAFGCNAVHRQRRPSPYWALWVLIYLFSTLVTGKWIQRRYLIKTGVRL